MLKFIRVQKKIKFNLDTPFQVHLLVFYYKNQEKKRLRAVG